MPRPSTPRVSSSRSNSPSPQPTSSTRAPGDTIAATTSKSMREPPGPRAASAIEKTLPDREQFRLVEQERVMALVGSDLGERNTGARGIERMDDGPRFRA